MELFSVVWNILVYCFKMSYLQFQRLDVVQQKCGNEKDAERLAGEKTEMTDKYDSLKSTLETSRSSMMQVKK